MCDTSPATYELKLKNGKYLHTTKPEELEHFYNSNGASISPAPKRKGGKSKGGKTKRPPQKLG